ELDQARRLVREGGARHLREPVREQGERDARDELEPEVVEALSARRRKDAARDRLVLQGPEGGEREPEERGLERVAIRAGGAHGEADRREGPGEAREPVEDEDRRRLVGDPSRPEDE